MINKIAQALSLLILVFFLTQCSVRTQPESSLSQTALPESYLSKQIVIKSQDDLKIFAQALQIRYHVVDNIAQNTCVADNPGLNCFRAQLRLTSNIPVKGDNWTLYFSHLSPIKHAENQYFDVKHINGDLHSLTPNHTFAGLQANKTLAVEIQAPNWHLAQSDIMPNYYLVSPGLQPELVPSTQATIDTDTGLIVLPHAGEFTKRKQVTSSASDATQIVSPQGLFQQTVAGLSKDELAAEIIPRPAKVKQQPGYLSLQKGLDLQGDIPTRASIDAALQALAEQGVKVHTDGVALRFTHVNETIKGPEAYRLDVTSAGIGIRFSHAKGASLALRSLAALMFVDRYQVPNVQIDDYPRFSFRGLHIDVARNFRDKAYLLRILEQMARYKLNKLHLHLADDEGWRLEIPGLPELTEVGSQRCHDLDETKCLLPQLGSGPVQSVKRQYYSFGDYAEILQAAQARHIEVIPSFDMPGHSRAAVVAMEARYRKFAQAGNLKKAEEFRLIDPQDTTVYSSIQHYHDNTLNVCIKSTYRFVEKVIATLIDFHSQAKVPLQRYHIGADETAGAWKESPACKKLLAENHDLKNTEALSAHFIERVANFLAENNIMPAAWSDGLSHTDPKRMPKLQSNAWTPLFWDGHKVSHEQLNQDWEVVLSIPDVLYFDFPYAAHPQEPGYYWASRATDTKKVFSFMPQNLPANAEIFLDRRGQPFHSDDRNSRKKPKREFIGMQGHLWSETVRSDTRADYMLFPRLLALAERAWHAADWELDYAVDGAIYQGQAKRKLNGKGPPEGQTDKPNANDKAVQRFFTAQMAKQQARDWQRFANVLGQKELAKLDQANIHYRVPLAAATVIDGQLHMRPPFPGLTLQYRLAGDQWQIYQAPVNLPRKLPLDDIYVRALAADGIRAGQVLNLDESLNQ